MINYIYSNAHYTGYVFYGSGSNSNYDSYSNWINSMTNNGTSFPYSIDSGWQYNFYMQDWANNRGLSIDTSGSFQPLTLNEIGGDC